MAALFMTIMLLCIEHVRAFAHQYHITAHEAMVLASAASDLTRKLSSTCVLSGGGSRVLTSPGKASSTQLHAWSIPAIHMPSLPLPSMPSSTDIPIHTLGSWYSEVDPTTKPPVYDDEYDNSYSFSSPTDDWPSMSSMSTEMEESDAAFVRSHMRRGPLKSIRRVAGRFKDIIVQ